MRDRDLVPMPPVGKGVASGGLISPSIATIDVNISRTAQLHLLTALAVE